MDGSSRLPVGISAKIFLPATAYQLLSTPVVDSFYRSVTQLVTWSIVQWRDVAGFCRLPRYVRRGTGTLSGKYCRVPCMTFFRILCFSVQGYHFLDGPYVEYKGSIPPEERGSLLTDLQAAFQDLVKDDIATTIETLSKDDAERVCNRLAKNFDFSEFGEEDVRVVTVAGWPCPCGGTHVKSTGQLIERGWSITGIKCKKGVVRVKYNLSKR
uniref:Threonyl/alanyl tRNA synthetase SAD domain-containing protein n=1 Tax=Odontella aurita TaxID=265563 RepID=A0A7S4JP57_9STRA|mmetsp:Transcript_50984/g.153276  ORF Transcript_50984/g.153276 Transcript_50984/m.153276 type:complete len:212 (+) Transcript_50984:378-1013(+)